MLSVMAMSAVAHAGTTISDKGYWPNEVGPSAYKAGGLTDSQNSASSYDWIAPRAQPATSVTGGSPLGRYQGGPKSR
jgi:hypothetical protein